MATPVSAHVKARLRRINAFGEAATAQLLGSRLLRWRLSAAESDTLLLLPTNLRTGDAGRVAEHRAGTFRTGPHSVSIGKATPFDVPSLAPDLARAACGFAWLGDLSADDGPDIAARAKQWTLAWRARRRALALANRRVDVTTARLRAMMTHADLIFAEMDSAEYHRTFAVIVEDLYDLAARWRAGDDARARLSALLVVAIASRVIEGQEALCDQIDPVLADELARQINPDGGHAHRSPRDVLDVLADVITLQRACAHLELDPPNGLREARQAMQRFLRTVRLGDHALAGFHGPRERGHALLSTILKLDPGIAPGAVLTAAGYARLEAGTMTAVVDTGPSAMHAMTRAPYASCLAFELSDGADLLIRGGVDEAHERGGLAPTEQPARVRATAAHSTLALAGQSSVATDAAPAGVDLPPIAEPAQLERSDEALTLTASHDGYVDRFGLRHSRVLRLASNGHRLDGEDVIDSPNPSRAVRTHADLPFSIHFHLGPRTRVRTGRDLGEVRFETLSGRRWTFKAESGAIYIEDSPGHGGRRGEPARQIVVRGATHGSTRVRWSITRDDAATDHDSTAGA